MHVLEHFFKDFSGNILGLDIRDLLSEILQLDLSRVDEFSLYLEVGEVREELQGIPERPERWSVIMMVTWNKLPEVNYLLELRGSICWHHEVSPGAVVLQAGEAGQHPGAVHRSQMVHTLRYVEYGSQHNWQVFVSLDLQC